jgi:hypothetical protein
MKEGGSESPLLGGWGGISLIVNISFSKLFIDSSE